MADWSTTQMICPIARLPNELLVEIVEHLEDPYSGRRSDLYNACLVSKQFARVAQPVLWRLLDLRGPWNRWGDHRADPVGYAVTLMRTAATAARAVKSLTLRYFASGVPLRLEALAAELPNVEHLRLYAVGRVDMTEVALFSNLSRLYIYSVDVSLSDPVYFPRLASLSFYSTNLSDYINSAGAFEPATLPALRHLWLKWCKASKEDDPGTQSYIPDLPPALLDQLECIQLDVDDLPSLDGRPFPSRTAGREPLPILFHTESILHEHDDSEWCTEVQYLQADRVQGTAVHVVQRLSSEFPRLRLLLGPRFERSSSPRLPLPTITSTIRMQGESRDITVMRYDPTATLDGFVVPEFSAYLREQAAAGAS